MAITPTNNDVIIPNQEEYKLDTINLTTIVNCRAITIAASFVEGGQDSVYSPKGSQTLRYTIKRLT